MTHITVLRGGDLFLLGVLAARHQGFHGGRPHFQPFTLSKGPRIKVGNANHFMLNLDRLGGNGYHGQRLFPDQKGVWVVRQLLPQLVGDFAQLLAVAFLAGIFVVDVAFVKHGDFFAVCVVMLYGKARTVHAQVGADQRCAFHDAINSSLGSRLGSLIQPRRLPVFRSACSGTTQPCADLPPCRSCGLRG